MRDSSKTKEQLLKELKAVRTRVAELEASEGEQRLRESEGRYRTVLETLVDGYYEVDIAGNFTFVNDSYCQLLGYPGDALIGMNNREYMDDETAKAVYQTFNAVYRTGKPTEAFDWEIVRKDGTRRSVQASVSLMTAPTGEATGFRGIVRDITEQKQVEEELRLKDNALENSLSAIAMSDMEGKITFVNQACLRLWGSDSKEELVGKPYWVLSYSEDKIQEIATAMLEKGEWAGEVVGTGKDGKEIHLQVFSAVVRDDKGNPAQTISSFIDVTERMRMEEALRESEELSRAILETAATGIYLLQDGRFQYVNQTFEQLSGYSRDELMGKTGLDYVHRDDREEVREKAKQVLKGQRGLPYEFRFVRKDSKAVWVLDWVSSIQYKGKRSVLGTLTDVTDRKKAEEELRQHREHLAELVEERTAELRKTQEVATRQAQEILEISTPILQLRKGILLAPIVGTLSSQRAQHFTERLLNRLVETSSTVALVDITGVPSVDTQTAHYLIRTISAVRLLGAQAILTGVRPAISRTLVELGIDLSSVVTRSAMEDGLKDAMNMLKQ